MFRLEEVEHWVIVVYQLNRLNSARSVPFSSAVAEKVDRVGGEVEQLLEVTLSFQERSSTKRGTTGT
jgi:hypothetical protein